MPLRRMSRPLVGMAPTRSGYGYWLVGSDGEVFPFGDAGQRGTSSLYPQFAPPIPGAPLIHAKLDDTGFHFNPSRVECGVYNVAFSYTRTTERIPGSDVVLNFYVDYVYVTFLSVRAGETGGSLLSLGNVHEVVTVDGVDYSTVELTIDPPIDPSAACATPVT